MKFNFNLKTFDGDYFEVKGNCKYLLAASIDNSIQIYFENIPCGSSGVTCTKSIDILYSSR